MPTLDATLPFALCLSSLLLNSVHYGVRRAEVLPSTTRSRLAVRPVGSSGGSQSPGRGVDALIFSAVGVISYSYARFKRRLV